MSNKAEFEKLLPEIEAISDSEVRKPDMPIDTFVQEGDNLYEWALDDKKLLFERGLKQQVLNILPDAVGACRYSESLWFKQRYDKEEAEKQWSVQSPIAYELRDDLIYEFEFAFVGNQPLLNRVAEIRNGNTHADMIQDLSNLSVLGTENITLLKQTKFDETLLPKAADTADNMGEILARATGDKAEDSEAKLLRDKAYTYLKQYVDEVRRYGKFVFRKNKTRLVGYRSQYYRNR